MKRWVAAFFVIASFFSQAEPFVEGEHYQVLEQPLNSKVEVREFFSFYCPHCFSQEPFMKVIDQSLPEDVPFKKNHVSGMAGKDINIENALTKALLVAEKLNVKDNVVASIFNYIHKSGADFNSVKDIQNVFIINGIDADKFNGAMGSFSIGAQQKQMQKLTSALRKQGIPTVPTLIINGRYRPLTENIKSIEHYTALVNHLVAKGV